MILRRMRAGKLGPVMTVMIAMGMLSACSTLSTDGTLLLARGGVATPAWKNAGIPPSEVASWIHHGFTASQAAKWRTVFPASFAHGYSNPRVGGFAAERAQLASVVKALAANTTRKGARARTSSQQRITVSRAAKWRDAGFSPSQAYRWDGAFTDGQVSPHQAALWRHDGFNATQAGAWSDSGFSPQTAQIWEKAGVDNAKEAAAWKSDAIGQNGITQPQVLKTAAAWRALWGGSYSSGMCYAATTLMQHGQSPNTVKPYITHGLSMAHPHEILNAQSLVHHGLNLSKAVYYGKHGVKYDHIAQYNHERKIRATQRARKIQAAQRAKRLQAIQRARARAEYNRTVAQVCHGKIHDNIWQLLMSSPYARKGACYLLPETVVSQWVGPKGAFVSGHMLFMTFPKPPSSGLLAPSLVIDDGAYAYRSVGGGLLTVHRIRFLAWARRTRQ